MSSPQDDIETLANYMLVLEKNSTDIKLLKQTVVLTVDLLYVNAMNAFTELEDKVKVLTCAVAQNASDEVITKAFDAIIKTKEKACTFGNALKSLVKTSTQEIGNDSPEVLAATMKADSFSNAEAKAFCVIMKAAMDAKAGMDAKNKD